MSGETVSGETASGETPEKAAPQPTPLQRALVTTLAIAAVSAAIGYRSSDWSFGRDFAMARISGWVAVAGLALGLSLSPLRYRFPRASIWRRAVGICTAFAACMHAGLSLRGPLDGAWIAALTWPYLLSGVLAFGTLMMLLLTSFPRVVRLLRVRHWKVLHRLVYAAAFFVVAHLMLSPWGSVLWKGLACVLLLVLLAYRIVRRR